MTWSHDRTVESRWGKMISVRPIDSRDRVSSMKCLVSSSIGVFGSSTIRIEGSCR